MLEFEAYNYFSLIYTTDHIFPVLPIKDMINEDGDPTTSHKLATGTKSSVLHLHDLFCPCVVWKATSHVKTKALNMRHQTQKSFTVSSLVLHSIKKNIFSMYQYKEYNIFI